MNKTFRKIIVASMAILVGVSFTSCGDANDYKDAYTDNPSWVGNYTDDENVSHPDELTGTKWVRGTGIKTNVYGEEIQGFVESLDFVKSDSVIVVMSQGATEGTWVDDSNTEDVPKYEYAYSNITGKFEIMKEVKDSKGNKTKSKILIGVAVNGQQQGITVVHYGDTPIQTYLIRQ